MFEAGENRYARALGRSALCFATLGTVLPAHGYVVKSGDTFSQIAREHLGPPVYGKQGTLTRLRKLNPQVADENSIAPGQIVQTDVSAPDLVRTPASTETELQEPGALTANANASGASPILSEVPPDNGTTPPSSGFSQFSFEPQFTYLRIDSRDRVNDTHAAFLSTLNAGASARWFQNWNSAWRSYVGVETLRVELQSPTTRSLQNSARFYSGLSLGADYRASAATNIGVELGVREEIFNRAVSEASLTLDPVAVPFVSGTLAMDLLSSQPYVLGLSAGATLLSSARTPFHNLRVGRAMRGSVYIHQLGLNNLRPKISASLYFDYKRHDSDSLDLTQTSLGVDFSYIWDVLP